MPATGFCRGFGFFWFLCFCPDADTILPGNLVRFSYSVEVNYKSASSVSLHPLFQATYGQICVPNILFKINFCLLFIIFNNFVCIDCHTCFSGAVS